jgi:hypothetical protein
MWVFGFAFVQMVTSPSRTTSSKTQTTVSAAGIAPSQPIHAQAILAASPATQLPSIATLPQDPTGLILPPIPMAPDYTYQNNYDLGQCTWYVAGRRKVPSSWGNADTWYESAISDDWSVGTTPAVGAIAWTPAGYYGHVALVEQVSADTRSVYISEMNYDGVGIKSFRWVPVTFFKYIYQPA